MYNVSEVANLDTAQRFKCFKICTLFLSAVSVLFFNYIIVKSTANQKMKFFRYWTIASNTLVFVVEVILAAWEPIRLFPWLIFYPMGLLSPMPAGMSLAMMGSAPAIGFFWTDMLLIILVERHFHIVMVIDPSAPRKRAKVYFLLIITAIGALGTFWLSLATCTDPLTAPTVLTAHVLNADILLSRQPSLIKFNYSWWYLPFLVAFIIANTFRTLLIQWLLHANLNYSKTPEIILSETSKMRFGMMLHATKIQLTILHIFSVPFTLFLGTFVLPPSLTQPGGWVNWPMLQLWLSVIFPMYPIVDFMAAVCYVKTYKSTLRKMILSAVEMIMPREKVTDSSLPHRYRASLDTPIVFSSKSHRFSLKN